MAERRRREYRGAFGSEGLGLGRGLIRRHFESENGDVHCSIDCLKRFRRQKPLLVGKLAVVCMQIALGGKTSVLETTL